MVDQHRFYNSTPLAARMRPNRLVEVVGQETALAAGSALRRLVEAEKPKSLSIVLWGPPGTGKTSIATLVAAEKAVSFVQLSAVTAGVKEVREVIEKAKVDLGLYNRQTVLFLDEIHRFSKSQQDSLLPAVESGWLVLIAATTENPSFAVIAPLLSRSLVVQLQPIDDAAVADVLTAALSDERGFASQAIASEGVLETITAWSAGDLRRALTILEASAATAFDRCLGEGDCLLITTSDVESSTARAANLYDRVGDQHYDIISAFIKSVRGSDADAAIHYLARMIDGGEDPRFIARRLIILASEDVGLADPTALTLAVSCAEAVALIGMPEGRIPLAEATIYLALAPKSNAAYKAIDSALLDVQNGLTPPVPSAMRSTSLARLNASQTGVNYKYPHDDARTIVEQKYADDRVLKKQYYVPKSVGPEASLSELWIKLKAIIRKNP
jgi:putative ATPase